MRVVFRVSWGVPGSSRIITGSSGSKVENGRSNAKLRVWESAASGTVLKGTPRSEHSDNVRGLAMLGKTGLFASCSNDGTILIRTLGDGSVVKSIDMPNHPALNRMSLVYNIVQYVVVFSHTKLVSNTNNKHSNHTGTVVMAVRSCPLVTINA